MATYTTLTVQQEQASRYNHPCGDLLDGGIRREYLDIVVPLYRASIEGDLEAAKLILDQDHRDLVRYSVNEKKETPLHVAAAGHSTEFVRYLVNKMTGVDLELQNQDGNTAFCIAAISGNVGIIEIMLEKNPALPIICGCENMMPLYLAALHRKNDVVTKLYNLSHGMTGDRWTDDSRNAVLLKCIEAGIFDVALRIVEHNIKLAQDKQHVWDMLQLLARSPEAFQESYSWFKSYLALFGLATIPALKEGDATRLLRLLWKRIMENPKDVIDEILRGPMIEKDKVETYPSQVLFIAAKMNNKFFLVELIREYPDLLWKTNDDGQTIFHVAVSYRHHHVYGLLYEIRSTKDLLTPMTDKQGNNILHLVGKNPEKNSFNVRVTPPFQMLSEFLWYKEVKGLLPSPYRQVKNAAGKTPLELFTENHEKLISEGMKSVNDSINISMVVAALVCTIAFSVVFQIPGGFNQNNGFPTLLHNKYFRLFLLLDAISFLFATASIILFLAVILSSQHGDMEVLFRLWMLGQLALLGSILFTVGAFIISFPILYRISAWMYIINVAAYAIVIVYAAVCIFILVDTVRATLLTRSLFRPKKHTLHNRN